MNPDTDLDSKYKSSSQFHMFLALLKNSEESFNIPVYRQSSKEPAPLNPSLCTPKIKIPLNANKIKVVLSKEICNISYTGESSRCFKNRIKEHNSHVTSAFCQHSVSSNHPRDISHLKILDHSCKQVTMETGRIIHI